ncbi:hypothetical protein J6590_032077 [Homalodisca vitripennis]|nr:hypothetical protein J6590_032077 [Homalodisca vitripennis]
MHQSHLAVSLTFMSPIVPLYGPTVLLERDSSLPLLAARYRGMADTAAAAANPVRMKNSNLP